MKNWLKYSQNIIDNIFSFNFCNMYQKYECFEKTQIPVILS